MAFDWFWLYKKDFSWWKENLTMPPGGILGSVKSNSTRDIWVIPDTNIFIEVIEGHFSLESELDRVITRKYQIRLHPTVLAELIILLNSASRAKKSIFRLAIQFAKQFPLAEDIESEESKSHYADAHLLKKAIADLSNPTNLTLIITNDKELRKNLRKQGCPVVFLRQRSHLVLEGFISD